MRRRLLNTVTWSSRDIINLRNVKECNLEPSKYYENIIIANKEASKTLLPKKRKFDCPALYADIAEPRKMMNEAYKLYVI